MTHPILSIEELTERAGLLYCHAAEHCNERGGIESYGIATECADIVGLGDPFRRDYGTAEEWSGSDIDFGELIHWAHNLG